MAAAIASVSVQGRGGGVSKIVPSELTQEFMWYCLFVDCLPTTKVSHHQLADQLEV